MRWSELPRWRLVAELAKLGITTHALVLDIQDVPELRAACDELHDDDDLLQLALDWFGDKAHPQPKQRSNWIEGIAVYGVRSPTSRTPDWERLPRLADDGLPTRGPEATRPRQRKPMQIAKSTVKELMLALARREAEQRKASLAGRKKLPSGSESTQEKIALRLGLHVTRVQQAEGLLRAGWDLLRTDPDFLVDDGFVRWPGVKRAAQILASERAGN